jgi:hypothetical protein
MCCVALGLLAGCTSTPGGASATETIHVNGYYAVGPSLDALIEGSPFIVSGRVLDFRYEIQYGIEGPNGEEPAPPKALTVATFEVTGVLAGTLKPGDKIEVYQMGGVMDKVMYSYDQVPCLADHKGEDLVVFLQTWDYLGSENTSYRVTDSFEGLWRVESGSLSLL